MPAQASVSPRSDSQLSLLPLSHSRPEPSGRSHSPGPMPQRAPPLRANSVARGWWTLVRGSPTNLKAAAVDH